MAVKVAEGEVVITADGSKIPGQLRRDLDRADGEVGAAGRRSGSLFGDVFGGSALGSFLGGGALRLAGAVGEAIGDGIRFGIDFALDGVQMAGDLEQSMGAVDAVFKDSAGAIHAFAETADSDLGMTANAYNELATVLGSQLKNGGTAIDEVAGKTSELITLGADMSAMFGGTAVDAVGAISAALRGERDTIERYGVSLTQAKVEAKALEMGLWDGAGALTENATQAATLALIYDQTKDAQGRFAAESDTLAGKQQRLKAAFEEAQTGLGIALMPAMIAFTDFASTTLVPILDDVIQNVGPLLGDALVNSGPVIEGFLTAFADSLPDLITLGTEVMPVLITALAEIIPWLVEVATKFQNGAEQWGEFFGKLENGAGQIGAFIDDANAKLDNGAQQWGGFFEAVGGWFQGFADNLTNGQNQVGSFFGSVGAAFANGWGQISSFFQGVWGLIGEIGGRFGNGAAQIGSFFGSVGAAFANGWGQISSFFSGLFGAIGTAIGRVGQFAGAVGSAIGSAIGYIASLPGQAAGALGNVGGILVSAGRSLVNGFISGIRSAAGAVGDAISSVLSFARGFFPSSPAKRGPFSGEGWRQILGSGGAVMDAFASGFDNRDITPTIRPLADVFTPSEVTGRTAARGSAATAGGPPNATGSRGPMVAGDLIINEAEDPLGSAGRIGREMRKWRTS